MREVQMTQGAGRCAREQFTRTHVRPQVPMCLADFEPNEIAISRYTDLPSCEQMPRHRPTYYCHAALRRSRGIGDDWYGGYDACPSQAEPRVLHETAI